MTKEELIKKLSVLYPPGSKMIPISASGLSYSDNYAVTIGESWEVIVQDDLTEAWYAIKTGAGMWNPHQGYLYAFPLRGFLKKDPKGKYTEHYAKVTYPENYNYFNH